MRARGNHHFSLDSGQSLIQCGAGASDVNSVLTEIGLVTASSVVIVRCEGGASVKCQLCARVHDWVGASERSWY